MYWGSEKSKKSPLSSMIIINLLILSSIGCIMDYDHDYGLPYFEYYFKLRSADSGGYILVPFPHNESDLQNSTNLDFVNHTNITSRSIESTEKGIALNISFLGPFRIWYSQKLPYSDFRIVNKNPLSMQNNSITNNGTRIQDYEWIFLNSDSESTSFHCGFVVVNRSESIRYGAEDFGGFSGSLVAGWQQYKVRFDNTDGY